MKDLEHKVAVAVITGGAHGIGTCIAEECKKNGESVCVIDKAEGDHFVGDISDKTVLEAFAEQVMRCSNRPAGSVPRWISPIWCCSSARTRRASSPARTSASTAA